MDKKPNQNKTTFNGLEFSNFKIFDQKIHFKFFFKGKNLKIPSGIQTHDLQIHSERSNPMRYTGM